MDPALRPTRVKIVEADREVFLNWETALDDGGRLRRCVACGCPDLFAEKVFPAVTGGVVALAFAGFLVGALGFLGLSKLAGSPYMLMAMSAILLLDVAILLFSRRKLVCYRCRSSFHGLPIARYHRSWDRSVAERYPTPSVPKAARPPMAGLPSPPWRRQATPQSDDETVPISPIARGDIEQ